MPSFLDPFINHPELKGKIVEPEESKYRDFDLSVLDERMRSMGIPSDWRHSDAYREQSRQRLFDGFGSGDLWVFAYGSLMWDPGFRFSEVRVAHLHGYERRFCLKSVLGRGTPEKPGLMAGLDLGTECEGLAFRVPAELVEEESRIIWRREMIMPAYDPVFLTATAGVDEAQVLAFVIDREAQNYLPNLTLQQTARYLATGIGVYGSSQEYLENMLSQFETLGIHDNALFALREATRAHVE